MSDGPRKGDSALQALVTNPNWLVFCKAIESGEIDLAAARSVGLRWRFARVNRDDEVIYTFRVSSGET